MKTGGISKFYTCEDQQKMWKLSLKIELFKCEDPKINSSWLDTHLEAFLFCKTALYAKRVGYILFLL